MLRAFARFGARGLAVNHTFFSDAAQRGLWSEESAWIYGWLLADGCVYRYGTERCAPTIHIVVQRRDRDVLEKIRRLLRSEHTISDGSSTGSWEGAGIYYRSQIAFRSREMAADLATLGIVPRKSKIAVFHDPLLQPENRGFLRHAVRGLLEGDGCLSFSKDWRVYWCGTYAVTSAVQRGIAADQVISSLSSAKGSLRQVRPDKTTWVLGYGGRRISRALCEWLYNDVNPECVLDRKAALAKLVMEGTPPDQR